MTVSVELRFDKDIQGLLNKIDAKTKDLRPVMERASTVMQEDVFRHFDQERGEKGAWKPLAASTKRWKAKHGWTKPLQNMGRLRGSNYPSGGKNYAQVKNDVSYAADHQLGTSKIPQRDFLWLGRDGMDKIGEMVLDYVAEVKF